MTPLRCPECGAAPRHTTAARRLPVAASWAVALTALVAGFHWTAHHDFRSTTCRPIGLAWLAGYTFDQDHGTLADIPQPIRQLDGQHISLEGYMIPLDQADNITAFALVPNLYFDQNRPPLIQETVVARVVDGRCLNYSPDAIRISGILHVRVETDDGYLISIYTLTIDHAEPAAAKAASR